MAEPSFMKRRQRPPRSMTFDYRDVETLQNFLTPGGRIVAARVSRLNAKQQRQLARAVKQARNLAMIANGSF